MTREEPINEAKKKLEKLVRAMDWRDSRKIAELETPGICPLTYIAVLAESISCNYSVTLESIEGLQLPVESLNGKL